jgi:plastocyanin
MLRGFAGSFKAVSALLLSGSLLAGAAITAFAQTQTVSVRLMNFQIAGVPATVPAGATLQFNATAMGLPHNLAIDGNGVDVRSGSPNLTDGQSGTFTLTAPMQPGTYNLYCPVGTHRAQGMVTTINVVAAAVALPRTGVAEATTAVQTAGALGGMVVPGGLAAAGLLAGVAGLALRRRRA